LPAVIEAFHAQAAGLAVLVAELPVLHADGRVFYADIASNRIICNGRDCLMGVFRDVTDRRQAAQELRQSRDELQAAYDGMRDGLLIADIETKRFVRANRAICRMLGYSEEQVLSLSVADIHPPADLPAVIEAFHAHAAGRFGLAAELPVLRADGSVFHADIATNRIVYNGRDCLMGAFRDVTDRRQAEQKLRQSEERYRGVVEASPDAVVMSDLRGRVVFASRQTWRLLGLPETEALAGRSIFDYVVEADREGLAANLAQLVQGGLRRNTQYTALRADGATVPVEASSVLIRDPQGRPQLAMAVIRDITDRRRAQNALERQRRTLELMLQASDHERRTIAYDIHDGLAQQLAGAIMQFQIHDYAKESNPEQAAKAYRGGVSLLQQGHAEARRIISGVRPPILDESGVVAAIAHLVHDPSVAHGPKVEFYSNTQFGRLPSIFENAIYRIAQEGLSNACKHSQSPKVRISLIERGGRVRIEIRDWGIGFNPRKMKKNHFGLPGIRERARLLGGKCRVRSAPGEGACITVDLPLPPELPEEE
jgi:PAS domain S-box-containing protein